MTSSPDELYRVARSWRHGLVFADVLTTPGLAPMARLVYAVLTTYANESGECWPAPARIATDAGIARSTVYESLDALDAAGLIQRTRRTAASGRTLPTVIRLLDRVPRSVREAESVREADTRECPPGGPMTEIPSRGSVRQAELGVREADTRECPPGGHEQVLKEQLTRAREGLPVDNREGRGMDRQDRICLDCRCLHPPGESCRQAADRRAQAPIVVADGVAAVRAARSGPALRRTGPDRREQDS